MCSIQLDSVLFLPMPSYSTGVTAGMVLDSIPPSSILVYFCLTPLPAGVGTAAAPDHAYVVGTQMLKADVSHCNHPAGLSRKELGRCCFRRAEDWRFRGLTHIHRMRKQAFAPSILCLTKKCHQSVAFFKNSADRSESRVTVLENHSACLADFKNMHVFSIPGHDLIDALGKAKRRRTLELRRQGQVQIRSVLAKSCSRRVELYGMSDESMFTSEISTDIATS